MMARGGREKASQRLNPNRKTIIICPTFVRYVMQEIARIGYVVSRCKAPYAIPTDETEVLGMVVLVVAYKIESHPSIHFLNLHQHHDGI